MTEPNPPATRYPAEVQRREDQSDLLIVWQDGSKTELPYRELRGYCPCAGCQGHMVREVRFRPPRKEAEPLVISPVGNYALSILWSDGHSTGIYRFEFLADIPNRSAARLAKEAARLGATNTADDEGVAN